MLQLPRPIKMVDQITAVTTEHLSVRFGDRESPYHVSGNMPIGGAFLGQLEEVLKQSGVKQTVIVE